MTSKVTIYRCNTSTLTQKYAIYFKTTSQFECIHVFKNNLKTFVYETNLKPNKLYLFLQIF